MTAAELVQVAFFSGLALVVTRFTWQTQMGSVGFTLFGCSVVTTVSYYTADSASQAVLELGMAGLIVNAARLANIVKPSRALTAIVALAVVDIAFVSTLALRWIDPVWLPFIYGAFTQAVFFLQCLLVAAPKVRDGIVARLSPGLPHRGMGGAHLAGDAVEAKDGGA